MRRLSLWNDYPYRTLSSSTLTPRRCIGSCSPVTYGATIARTNTFKNCLDGRLTRRVRVMLFLRKFQRDSLLYFWPDNDDERPMTGKVNDGERIVSSLSKIERNFRWQIISRGMYLNASHMWIIIISLYGRVFLLKKISVLCYCNQIFYNNFLQR